MTPGPTATGSAWPQRTVSDEPTAWDALHERRLDEGVTTQLALDAFATLIAPIPGGTAAETGDIGTVSGTPAVVWMLGQWDELTEAQQDAFHLEVYGQERGAGTRRPLGGAAPVRAAPVGDLDDTDRDVDLEDELRPIVEAIENDFAERSGILMPDELTVRVSAVAKSENPRAAAAAAAAPGAPGDPERASACVVTFYPLGTDLRLSGDEHEFRQFISIVAHELYHCHQFGVAERRAGGDVIGARHLRAGVPSWISEGTAQWAGNWYAQQRFEDLLTEDTWWVTYLDWSEKDSAAAPTTRSLYELSYDAVGFYSHIAERADASRIWGVLDDAYLASAIDDDDAFTILVDRSDPSLLSTWAASFFHDSSMGEIWQVRGPGLPDLDPPPVPQLGDISAGGGPELTRDGDRTPGVVRGRLVVTDSSAEVFTVTARGHGAVQWNGSGKNRSQQFTAPGVDPGDAPFEQWYCSAEDCQCVRDGAADRSTPVSVEELESAKSVAVALANDAGEDVWIQFSGDTIDDFCNRLEDPGGRPRDDIDDDSGEAVSLDCDTVRDVVSEVVEPRKGRPIVPGTPEDADAVGKSRSVFSSCQVASNFRIEVSTGDLVAANFTARPAKERDCDVEDDATNTTDEGVCSWAADVMGGMYRNVGVTGQGLTLTMVRAGTNESLDDDAIDLLAEVHSELS
ncbi:hypothetical protein [Phytoactinopolyspora endophytica]|uniref:hypothetical protein n=1 Tax=Phytoactinopolyspora endophytica TaxID=1642495 RepID=UPI00101DB9C7|nr:hypothetical protein [Phytoactinopolyspora endophytica]